MATVIDALMVTLGLDAKDFKKGAKETDESLKKTSDGATKASKDMEAWGKNAATSLSKLRNEALALLSVFTAGMGIKNFAEQTIGGTASLSRMSQNLNMSAKDLAQWQLANKNAGGSVEGMTAQLKEAQQAVADYKLGINNSANQAFWTVGGKDSDFKDAETLLRARSRIIQGLIAKFGVGVAMSKAKDMGISEDTFNLLKQGPDAVDRLREAQSRLAQTQADLSDRAEAFRQKWDSVQNQLVAVGVVILTKLMPHLERFAEWLDANQDKITEWGDKTAKVVGVVADVVEKASSIIVPILKTIADGWKNIYDWVKAAGEAINNLLPQSIRDKIGAGTAWLFDKLGIREAVDDMMSPAANAPKAAPPAGNPAMGGPATSNDVIAYFKSKGWTDEQAAGIAANLKKESEFRPDAVGDGGRAYGIAQWHPDRQAEFAKWAGKDIRKSTREEQMAFVHYELTQGKEKSAGDALRNAKTAAQAGAIVSSQYERPAARDKEAMERGQSAAILLAQASRATAAQSAANTAQVAQAAKTPARTAGSTSTSSSETNINGPINVYTQAKDADGIARDIKPALSRVDFASQANTGLA